MTRIIQAKYKIDRRLGVNLWGRSKSPFNTRKTAPGQHGARRKKPTEFGIQLFAKQKLKGYYGSIGEKMLRKYYDEATRRKGDTSKNLIGLLESRLDAVIYRAKFVPTVFAARQFVSHGHITVNGKRVTIGSYIVKAGDVIEVKEKSRQIPMVIEAIASSEREFCEYVDVDADKFSATFVRIPTLDEVPYPVQMEPNLVIEFYSR